ncbi:hypothetical protein OIU78_002257 [Salix suchowensis]|nr:hypothetical protein OIU78_002257 [Salix suchowensis]
MIYSCFRYITISFQLSQDNLHEPGSSISKLSFRTSNKMHNAGNKILYQNSGEERGKCNSETKGKICEKRMIHYLRIKIDIIGKAMPAICNYLIRVIKKKKKKNMWLSMQSF